MAGHAQWLSEQLLGAPSEVGTTGAIDFHGDSTAAASRTRAASRAVGMPLISPKRLSTLVSSASAVEPIAIPATSEH
jgi:hypothetical protein